MLNRRTRNPFLKGADGVSPSLINRTRRRTRFNVFTPTVIDNTVVIKSKFFTQSPPSEKIESDSKSSQTKITINDDETEEKKVEGKENININMMATTEQDVEQSCGDSEQKSLKEVEIELSKEEELSTYSELFKSPEQSSSDNLLDGSIGLSSVYISTELESQIERDSTEYSQKSEGSQFMNTEELLKDLNTPRSSSPDSELDYSVNSSSIDSVRPSLFKWTNTRTLGVKKLESSQRYRPVGIFIYILQNLN